MITIHCTTLAPPWKKMYTIVTYMFRQQPKYGQQNIGKLFKDLFSEFKRHFVHIMWCSSSRAIQIHRNSQHKTRHPPQPHDGHLTVLHLPPLAFWKMETWFFPWWSSSHNNLEKCWPLQPCSWIPEFECFLESLSENTVSIFPTDRCKGTWHASLGESPRKVSSRFHTTFPSSEWFSWEPGSKS